jgi:hypothetical protein
MTKRAAGLSVLTANSLHEGTVVFLDFDGSWVTSIDGAAVARSPDEARALEARGAFDAANNLVVEPYLVEVREIAGRLSPVRYRERVRAAGPSVLDDVPGYALPSDGASSPSPRSPSGSETTGRPLGKPEGEREEGRGALTEAA